MFAKFGQHRQQAGDTIVEVMVVVAILGLAFSIAYATATHSLNKTRNSEEHAEALQYITSQVELLRNDAQNPGEIRLANATYCMDPTTDKPVPSTNAAYANVCTVGIEGIYLLSIKYQANDVYEVSVSWPGISDLGTQHEDLYYKLHAL